MFPELAQQISCSCAHRNQRRGGARSDTAPARRLSIGIDTRIGGWSRQKLAHDAHRHDGDQAEREPGDHQYQHGELVVIVNQAEREGMEAVRVGRHNSRQPLAVRRDLEAALLSWLHTINRAYAEAFRRKRATEE